MDLRTANEKQLISFIATQSIQALNPMHYESAKVVLEEGQVKLQFSPEVVCKQSELIKPKGFSWTAEDVGKVYGFLVEGKRIRVYLYEVEV